MKSPAKAKGQPLRAFHVMAKPIGARCNLACKYCYYLEKERALYPGPGVPRMDDATLESFIRDYAAAQPAGSDIQFDWQGGEPTLLGLDTFRRIVAWQRLHAPGRRVLNTLHTNGTLLDDAWGEFLHAEKFRAAISIDGPREMHDAFRTDAGGLPTWEKVMAGLRVLRRHRVEFDTVTVVHRRNCRHPHEVYDFLVSSGSRHIQFIPLVERRPDAAEAARGLVHGEPTQTADRQITAAEAEFLASAQSLPPGRFGKFLRTVFDHWIRRDVGRVFVRQFDSALSAWAGSGPTACAHTPRCGQTIALEHDGEVYACDHYVYPGFSLGNLNRTPLAELANGPAAARFAAAKAGLPARCLACPVRFACNGDCPKHRFVRTAEGEPPVSYLCGDYGRFFRHVDPAMRAMVELLRAGRAPAEIMRRDLSAPAFS